MVEAAFLYSFYLLSPFYRPAKQITGLWLIVPHTLMSRDHLEPIYNKNTMWGEKIDKWNKKRVITTSAALHQWLPSVLEAVSLFTSPFIRFPSLLMCLSHSPPPLTKSKQRPKISYQYVAHETHPKSLSTISRQYPQYEDENMYIVTLFVSSSLALLSSITLP